jgi:subtilisin family serine protease
MKRTILGLTAAALLAAPALAQTRYILRYTESEPLSSFLRRNRLNLEQSVRGVPVYSVIDRLNRRPSDLMASIGDDDSDISIELDQILRLPIHTLRSAQTEGAAAASSLGAAGRPVPFMGGTALSTALTQPAMKFLGADASWGRHGWGTGLVAVVDTGVDGTHPFFGRQVTPGIDLIDPRGTGSELKGLPLAARALINPTTTPLLWRPERLSNGHAAFFERGRSGDPRIASLPAGLGHGTMVAGVIRLAAPSARILPIRAFSQNGQGRLFHVISAIHEAERRGARVVNLSLNTLVASPELERTAEEVSDRGMILVASTGNEGRIDIPSYPASYGKVAGIASVTIRGQRSAFSNANPDLTLAAAPGEAVLLPFPGNRWALGWGTSFSAPWASGMASKLLTRKPDATGSDLESALGSSIPTFDQNLGKGLMHYLRSLDQF